MERMLHALDLSVMGDWEGAKRALEDLDDPLVARLLALITEQQRLEKERAERITVARHELGNALSVAQANVEGMVDGVLPPTPERLTGIRDALQSCGAFLMDIRRETRAAVELPEPADAFNICELLSTQTHILANIAQAKHVLIITSVCEVTSRACMYVGDVELVAQIVRDVLLTAIRTAPPGAEIRVGCAHPTGELLLSIGVSDAEAEPISLIPFTQKLQSLGAPARTMDLDGERASFFITLPAVAENHVAAGTGRGA